LGEAPGPFDPSAPVPPAAQAASCDPAPAPPSPTQANTIKGSPQISGSTFQLRDVENLHVHAAPAAPLPPQRSDPPPQTRRNSQPSGVIIRLEIGHQRCIEIYDEGLARYVIDAHLKELGLGHEQSP
jgi:hypothetical protein